MKLGPYSYGATKSNGRIVPWWEHHAGATTSTLMSFPDDDAASDYAREKMISDARSHVAHARAEFDRATRALAEILSDLEKKAGK